MSISRRSFVTRALVALGIVAAPPAVAAKVEGLNTPAPLPPLPPRVPGEFERRVDSTGMMSISDGWDEMCARVIELNARLERLERPQ